MADPVKHRFQNLAGVHPTLAGKVGLICDAMELLGFTMLVTDGLRSAAVQQALYAHGRTAPGKIVTNADGITKRSNHQAHTDGLGHAVDLCFLVEGTPSWDEKLPWRLYGEMAKALKLQWGGDWSSISDKPHIELP